MAKQRDYFRFSKWVKSKPELHFWAYWFTKHGIPWCITKHGGRFAIWRKGREAVEEEWDGNDEDLIGEITDSWKWEGQKKRKMNPSDSSFWWC